jgi:hypothetical protein
MDHNRIVEWYEHLMQDEAACFLLERYESEDDWHRALTLVFDVAYADADARRAENDLGLRCFAHLMRSTYPGALAAPLAVERCDREGWWHREMHLVPCSMAGMRDWIHDMQEVSTGVVTFELIETMDAAARFQPATAQLAEGVH